LSNAAGALDGLHQHGIFKWLMDDVHRAKRVSVGLSKRLHGDDDGGDRGQLRVAQLGRPKLPAVHMRQHQVEQDGVEWTGAHLL
jgi:hypothetical protein